MLNVQSDLLESLDTFVVVPRLRPGGFTAIEGINPIIQVAGQPFVLAVQGMTAIAGSQIKDRVARTLARMEKRFSGHWIVC